MNREIDYEALTKRLEQTIKIAKKLGLQVVPCGGYAMDYSMDRLPSYPIGLFGALSIIEGPGARSRLGLTYLETAAIEEGFNSVQFQNAPIRLIKQRKRKKDATWLKLEAIGEELAKKVVHYTSRSSRPKKKRRGAASASRVSRFAAALDQGIEASGGWIVQPSSTPNMDGPQWIGNPAAPPSIPEVLASSIGTNLSPIYGSDIDMDYEPEHEAADEDD